MSFVGLLLCHRTRHSGRDSLLDPGVGEMGLEMVQVLHERFTQGPKTWLSGLCTGVWTPPLAPWCPTHCQKQPLSEEVTQGQETVWESGPCLACANVCWIPAAHSPRHIAG